MPISEAKFLSTPSARRATGAPYVVIKDEFISIHALCEEGDKTSPAVPTHFTDFYPRPLRGGRLPRCSVPMTVGQFLSTPSARRATSSPHFSTLQRCISIHALCEEGDMPCSLSSPCQWISIHALCEEGDTRQFLPVSCVRDFYPRPLRGGRRFPWSSCSFATIFLSTPSARRATYEAQVKIEYQYDFYPRPLRGGRPRARCVSGTSV